MFFSWIVGVVVILCILAILYSDQLGAKRKHSTYFQKVQQCQNKPLREPHIPEAHRYDKFFSRINNI